MTVVIAALMPVFLLIVLGAVLRRTLMRLDTQWHGLEQLTYYVLFPVLLVQTLVKADLTAVPIAGVGGALLLAALVMSLLCLGLRGPLAPRRGRRTGLHLDLPGRDPLADLCRAVGIGQSLRQGRARAGVGCDGRDHPAGQRAQRRGAGAVRVIRKAVGGCDRDDGGEEPADLGLRHRPRHQHNAHPVAKTLA